MSSKHLVRLMNSRLSFSVEDQLTNRKGGRWLESHLGKYIRVSVISNKSFDRGGIGEVKHFIV